jgi:CO/xanthine dehydrogenase Mo-binding subunit
MIDVEYEELAAVFDPQAALAADAPVLHPDHEEYRYLRGTRQPRSHPNLQGEGRLERGDVDAAFASAAHVFEHSFDVGRTFQGHLEPRASVVWMEGDRYHVCSTNKSPFRLRDQLAIALDIPSERIVVDSGFIGGDFGGKGFSIDEYVLIVLARETGRPVRYVSRYTDDMRAGNTRHAGHLEMRTGVDADGRIVAHEARFVFDGGAYAAAKGNAALMPGGGMTTLVGYRVQNARVESMCAYTNNVPGGHARAPGQPQASFASESHIDLIARALGRDPLEFRRLNAIRDGDTDIKGKEWRESTLVEVLDTLRREAHLDQPPLPGRGWGVSLGGRASPEGHGGKDLAASLVLTVTGDGQVEILTGVADQGAGAHSVMQRVAAEELGIPAERVTVRRGTTDEAPFDLGAGGSRVTPVVGGAARAGAAALAQHLDEMAPGRPILEQLAHAAQIGGVRVDGEFQHEAGLHCTYAYAVEVEVDQDTGQVRVTDCVLVADVGTVINPLALHGQLVGGFVSGLGQALMEEVTVDEGTVTAANLGDYKMPVMADVPPIRVVLLTGHPGGGPFGAKSAGELANVSIAPAIANAVESAVGVRITSLPITAEKVFMALQARPRRQS